MSFCLPEWVLWLFFVMTVMFFGFLMTTRDQHYKHWLLSIMVGAFLIVGIALGVAFIVTYLIR